MQAYILKVKDLMAYFNLNLATHLRLVVRTDSLYNQAWMHGLEKPLKEPDFSNWGLSTIASIGLIEWSGIYVALLVPNIYLIFSNSEEPGYIWSGQQVPRNSESV